MKKQFTLLVVAFTLAVTSLMAQDARPRQTPQDKTKAVMEKLAAFDLTADTRAKTETIFTDYFTAQQEAMKEARAAGTDRTAMKEKRDQLVTERNAKLKEVLTAEQYAKWASEIEPAMKQQRQAPGAAPVETKQ